MVLLAIINLDQKSYPQLQFHLLPQQSLLHQVSFLALFDYRTNLFQEERVRKI